MHRSKQISRDGKEKQEESWQGEPAGTQGKFQEHIDRLLEAQYRHWQPSESNAGQHRTPSEARDGENRPWTT